MKMTTLLLFAGLLSTLANDSYAQSTRVSLDMQNATVEDVLDAIESKSEFFFLFNQKLIDVERKVDVYAENVPISELLGDLFSKTDVNYMVYDRQIILAPKEVSMPSAVRQGIKITGKVTDGESGEPLPGVSIQIQGTQQGATTDLNGNYTIEVSNEASVLVFSFVGYNTEAIDIGGRTVVDLTMIPDIKKLDEVVVIGYGTRAKKDITTAISTISSKDIETINAGSVELAMAGKMAGVQVVNGGSSPTARPTIRIRGLNTWNVAAAPLYVIDGVPITEYGSGDEGRDARVQDLRSPINIMSFINPDDIESISVLKDASAAAIYGIRASNGVILITTKKGKEGRANVEFSMTQGFQNIPKQYDVLNTAQYTALYREAYANYPPETANMPPVFNPASPDYLGNSPTYEWQTPFLNKNGANSNYSLRVSGGTQNINYYVSAGYDNIESPYIGDKLERYTITSNLNARISKFITTGVNVKIASSNSYNNANWGGGSGNLWTLAATPPWQPIYDEGNEYPEYLDGYMPAVDLEIDPSDSTFNVIKKWGEATRMNPYGMMSLNDNRYKLLRDMGTAYVEFEPLKGLKLKGTLSVDWYANLRKSWEDKDFQYFNTTPSNPLDLAEDWIDDSQGSYGERQTTNLNIVKQFTASYERSFGDHNFNLLFDAMDQQYSWTTNDVSTEYMNSEDPQFRTVGGPKDHIGGFTGFEKAALQGYLGRLSYNYNSKYYVDGTIRRDGSYKFAPENRWGTFYGFSLAWRISAEKFMQNITFINDMKIRGGWGQLGNQETRPYQYLSTINSQSTYSLGSNAALGDPEGLLVIGFNFPDFTNRDLAWETTATSNIAVDAILFNGLDITLEYFNKITDGILQDVPLAGSVGSINNPVANVAKVRNRGFESSLTWRDKIGNLNYSVSGNITTLDNEVLEVYDGIPIGGEGGRIEVGYPINYYWGYKVGGIFQSQPEIDDYNKEIKDDIIATEQQPGDMWFQNVYGDPDSVNRFYNPVPDSVVNQYDRAFLGSSLPGFFYGFGLSASWKGFDLTVNFQGVGDMKKINDVRWGAEDMSSKGINQWTSVLDHWTPENPSTEMPRAVATDPAGNTRFSDRWVENAGYFRLAYAELGYNIPRKLVDYTRIMQGLRVWVSGTNLLTVTNWSGIDPENELFPIPRVYSFGLRATF